MSSSHLDKKDSNKIRFSYDFKGFRFNTNFYRATMTKNKLAKHEILNFFQRMYQKLNGFNDLKELSTSYLKAATLSILLILVGLFFSLYGHFSMKQDWTIPIGIIFVLAGLVLAKYGRNKCLQLKKDTLEKTRQKIIEYIKSNGATFAQKHLKWNVPKNHFDWLELEVEGKSKTGLEMTTETENNSKNGEYEQISHTEINDHTEEVVLDVDDTNFNYAT